MLSFSDLMSASKRIRPYFRRRTFLAPISSQSYDFVGSAYLRSALLSNLTQRLYIVLKSREHKKVAKHLKECGMDRIQYSRSRADTYLATFDEKPKEFNEGDLYKPH